MELQNWMYRIVPFLLIIVVIAAIMTVSEMFINKTVSIHTLWSTTFIELNNTKGLVIMFQELTISIFNFSYLKIKNIEFRFLLEV